jgi:hypothetical protein
MDADKKNLGKRKKVKEVTRKMRKEIARLSTTKSSRIHVQSKDNGWVVRKDGNVKASGYYSDKRTAISAAKKTIKLNVSLDTVVIHDANGNVLRVINK